MMATDVVVLTQRDCALCDQAKAVLARVAADVPLSITEVALDSPNGRRIAADAGVMFPPGIVVDGKPFSYGRLSERKLRRELRRPSAQAEAGR